MKFSTYSRFVALFAYLLITGISQAQTIEPSPGSSLTVTEDISLSAGKVFRLADTVLLKSSSASVGNLFLGLQAGTATTSATNNTFLGTAAGLNSTGAANTFVGYSAGRYNTTGQFNTFIGVQAGINNTAGSANFMMGTNAGAANTTGAANFFLGDNTGGQNTTGGYNVYLGANAGNGSSVNGSNNISIGFESGRGNQNGSNNTFLGFRADAGAANINNATAIGNNAKVTISNAVVLGSGANVGIGNTAPTARLHITSGQTNQSGLRLENLTSAAVSTVNSSKFLTVDGSGNVILANYASGNRAITTTSEDLWEQKGNYLQPTQNRAIVIGNELTKMPVGYRLYVQDGILTERIKVAVKNTADWSDKVFESGYQLKSLPEVEQFIHQHHHLPGVPSAKEMVKNGNDLQQTDARLLEKIEELTLHSIQQQKEIEQLKQLVKQLLEKK